MLPSASLALATNKIGEPSINSAPAAGAVQRWRALHGNGITVHGCCSHRALMHAYEPLWTFDPQGLAACADALRRGRSPWGFKHVCLLRRQSSQLCLCGAKRHLGLVTCIAVCVALPLHMAHSLAATAGTQRATCYYLAGYYTSEDLMRMIAYFYHGAGRPSCLKKVEAPASMPNIN